MAPVIVKMLMAIFDASTVAEQENRALRELLRRQGLSDATIRRRVAAYLKESQERDSVLQLMKKASEEILARLPDLDLQEALEAMPIKGKPQ
jgi:hypothetical protein